jgi:hypothetical protein
MLFVSYSYATMDSANLFFGNDILDHPEIHTKNDLREVQKQILEGFGMPDKFRWVVVLNWILIPDIQEEKE